MHSHFFTKTVKNDRSEIQITLNSPLISDVAHDFTPDVNSDIWKHKITPYFSLQDQRAIPCVSTRFRAHAQELKSGHGGLDKEWRKNAKLLQVKEELKKLTKFIDQFDIEINKRRWSCMSQNTNKYNVCLVTLLLGVQLVCDYFLADLFTQRTTLQETLDRTLLPYNKNQTCTAELDARHQLKWCQGHDDSLAGSFNSTIMLCYDICEDLRSVSMETILPGLVAVIMGIMLVCLLVGNCRKNLRFNNSSLLSDLSPNFQLTTKELLNEFRFAEHNPFEDIHLNSSADRVIRIARATKMANEMEFKRLAGKKIEIIESTPVDEKYSDQTSVSYVKKNSLFKAAQDTSHSRLLSDEYKSSQPSYK